MSYKKVLVGLDLTDGAHEVFAVANIVGGTIVIPHTRRGAEFWEELNK